MFPQPAFSNGVIEPGAVLLGRAAFLEQEWTVDLLNVDAPALQRLGRVGDLQQLARGHCGISERSRRDVLHAASMCGGLFRAFSAKAPPDRDRELARTAIAKYLLCGNRSRAVSDSQFCAASLSIRYEMPALNVFTRRDGTIRHFWGNFGSG